MFKAANGAPPGELAPRRRSGAAYGVEHAQDRHNFPMNETRGGCLRIRILVLILAFATLARFGPAALAADPSTVVSGSAPDSAPEGEVKFNTYCRTCHSWRKDDNRLGPSLYDVIGRKAGTAPGYLGYSSSMRGSGIVWTKPMIDKWIADPYKVIPDTNMRPFPGIPDPATRQKIITFLESHHDPAQ
jgi:cytochrome c